MDDQIKAEMKNVVRIFQRYTSEERADRGSSHRLGHRQRRTVGEFFFTHPDVPGLAFPTRSRAAMAALEVKGRS